MRLLLALAFLSLALLSWLPFSPPELEVGENQGDKLNHVLAFLALYLLAWRVCALPLSTIAAMLFFYGLLLETVQFFLPDRTFSWADIMANLTGIGLGAGIVMLLTWLGAVKPRIGR